MPFEAAVDALAELLRRASRGQTRDTGFPTAGHG